jgi:TATA-binding protein-associated factor Taf7
MGKFIITEEDRKNIRGLYEQFNQELDPETTNNDQVENPHKEELINKLNNIDTKMEKLYTDLTNSGNPIDKKRFMYQLRNDVESITHNMMEDPNIDRNQFNELNNLFSEKYHEMINKYRNMMR